MKRAIWLMGALLAAAALWATAASAVLSDADACRVAKLKAAGTYMDCRMEEEAKAVSLNVPPGFTLCDERLAAAFAKVEATYGAACPSFGDLDALMERIAGDTTLVGLELGGAPLEILSRMPATGQMICYELGLPTECAGTGQDAEFLAGVPRMSEFADNGDGTITDIVTGLMWEKKVAHDGMADPANLHDVDNHYPWAGECAGYPSNYCRSDAACPDGGPCVVIDEQGGTTTVFGFVAMLNEGAGFAGYTDWRVPNIRELATLPCYGTCIPAIPRAFNGESCGPACTDIADPACSCTDVYIYWSSTTSNNNKPDAWTVEFINGSVIEWMPLVPGGVRAVRGGL